MARELAVVLSGGGTKGALQVGVLDELVVSRGIKIDIVAGVSTGAIQALGVAQDVPAMVQQWLDIKGNKDIYRERRWGPPAAFLEMTPCMMPSHFESYSKTLPTMPR